MSETAVGKRACGDRQFDKGCIECQKHEVKGLKALLRGLVDENRDMMVRIESDGVDANQLADALRALGLDYDSAAAGPERQGDGWHYFSCPTRYNFPDCDVKCIAARKALDKYQEQPSD